MLSNKKTRSRQFSGQRKGLLQWLVLAFMSSWIATGIAQESSNPLDEIVVTSSLIPVAQRRIGTSVSVLTEDEIEAYGNLVLVDILRQQPGVGSSNSGGAGKATALRIRGEEGFRTLTIFDGMRLSDPSTPRIGPQMQHVLSNGVSRIEILRGPQGLAYGADAGGVINMTSEVLREGLKGTLDTQAGEFGTQQYSGTVAGGNDVLDFFLAATNLSSDGYNSRTSDTLLRDDDGYDNTTFHGRLGAQLSESLRLTLTHRDVDGEGEFDGCLARNAVHDCTDAYEFSASRLALDYQLGDTQHSLAYTSTETEREKFGQEVSTFVADGEIGRWEYIGTSGTLPGFDLVWGVDFEEVTTNEISRDNKGTFLEYLSDFSRNLFVNVGLRYDDNDDFGSNTSYRLSGAYLFDLQDDASLKIRASVGTGFRAPSPYEVAYNSGPLSSSPASEVILRQEESEGWELGVEYTRGSQLHLELIYFDQQIEDAIFFDQSGSSGFLQDVGVSISQGIEAIVELQLAENWRLVSNYTYNDTEQPNGKQRRRRPEDLLNLGLTFSALDARLTLSGFYRISRDAVDETRNSTIPLDDFEVFDFNVNYKINDQFAVYGRLENAFDEEYQEVSGFNASGRAAYVGVKFNFSDL